MGLSLNKGQLEFIKGYYLIRNTQFYEAINIFKKLCDEGNKLGDFGLMFVYASPTYIQGNPMATIDDSVRLYNELSLFLPHFRNSKDIIERFVGALSYLIESSYRTVEYTKTLQYLSLKGLSVASEALASYYRSVNQHDKWGEFIKLANEQNPNNGYLINEYAYYLDKHTDISKTVIKDMFFKANKYGSKFAYFNLGSLFYDQKNFIDSFRYYYLSATKDWDYDARKKCVQIVEELIENIGQCDYQVIVDLAYHLLKVSKGNVFYYLAILFSINESKYNFVNVNQCLEIALYKYGNRKAECELKKKNGKLYKDTPKNFNEDLLVKSFKLPRKVFMIS